ncbi:MAG: rod shape-determining protein MreC [Chromatiales bacterium]|jgi:rod shape-determining protein MreC|nr:rod shape-determining protein MreC [Chromatiales bacterium]
MALTTVEREPGSFRSASPGLRLILFCILSITLMVLDHRNEHLVGVRKALAVTLYPVQLLVSAPFDIRRTVSESMATRSQLQEENLTLRQEVLIRSVRLQRMAALEAENARLRALLDSTEIVGDQILIAEIVSVDMNPFRNMLVINKGGSDGIYIGQALIDADGIVGQITRDRHYSAEAMLVTDVDHALPVELARNRLRTIAVGTGELDRLSLPFLPLNADVQIGDLLVSSGLGGTFPPGYPVGVVRDVRKVTGQPFLEIDAEPAAALNRIREVLLIKPGGRDPFADPDNIPETNKPATISAPPPADNTTAAGESG